MSEQTIDISGQRFIIQVYPMAKAIWIAVGEHLGEQLRTRGQTATQAVMAWRRAAEFKADPGPEIRS